ncbi:MAG: SRPBCC domain-containing protein [Thermonemataceae bacterium]
MAKNPFFYLLLCGLLTGCYSLKKSIKESKPYSSQINWAEGYTPADAQFFIHNAIEIEASPQTVWDILIQAEDWPNWYEGMSGVKVPAASDGILFDSAAVQFRTMGLDFDATIVEFEPPTRLGWLSVQKRISGYHAWLIIPTEKGCKVITDESQKGSLTFLQKVFVPNKLKKLHDIWLAELKKKAEQPSSGTF